MTKLSDQSAFQRAKALYPGDMDTRTHPGVWHCLVWEAARSAQEIGLHGDVSARMQCLMFTDRRDRAGFQRWLAGYRPFFHGAPLEHVYLPPPPPGVLGERAAGFLRSPVSNLDQHHDVVVGYDQTEGRHRDFHEKSEAYLREVRPFWAWCSVNCRFPVYRVHGGWVFSAASDLAKYEIMDPFGKRERHAA